MKGSIQGCNNEDIRKLKSFAKFKINLSKSCHISTKIIFELSPLGVLSFQIPFHKNMASQQRSYDEQLHQTCAIFIYSQICSRNTKYFVLEVYLKFPNLGRHCLVLLHSLASKQPQLSNKKKSQEKLPRSNNRIYCVFHVKTCCFLFPLLGPASKMVTFLLIWHS